MTLMTCSSVEITTCSGCKINCEGAPLKVSGVAIWRFDVQRASRSSAPHRQGQTQGVKIFRAANRREREDFFEIAILHFGLAVPVGLLTRSLHVFGAIKKNCDERNDHKAGYLVLEIAILHFGLAVPLSAFYSLNSPVRFDCRALPCPPAEAPA